MSGITRVIVEVDESEEIRMAFLRTRTIRIMKVENDVHIVVHLRFRVFRYTNDETSSVEIYKYGIIINEKISVALFRKVLRHTNIRTCRILKYDFMG